MKQLLNHSFSTNTFRVFNKRTQKQYVEYDPASGKLNDGSGYVNVPDDEIEFRNQDDDVVDSSVVYVDSIPNLDDKN